MDLQIRDNKKSISVTDQKIIVKNPIGKTIKPDNQINKINDSEIQKIGSISDTTIDSEASRLGINKENIKKEAIHEALKEEAKSEVASREAVREIMDVEPRSLFHAKSVFPFELFPDAISIEETRVNIISRQFFFTRNITAIGIDNIIDVSVQTSIFFATLHITSKMYVQNIVEPFEIRFLKKKEAIKARNIIEGLRIITSKKVNTTKIAIKELVKEVEEVGKPNGIPS